MGMLRDNYQEDARQLEAVKETARQAQESAAELELLQQEQTKFSERITLLQSILKVTF